MLFFPPTKKFTCLFTSFSRVHLCGLLKMACILNIGIGVHIGINIDIGIGVHLKYRYRCAS